MTSSKILWITSFAILTCVAVPAYAVDGVVLISQATSLHGNVTPGDLPGFPVTISVPGSYKLSSNLTVPDVDTTAIEVTATNTTIDLNGCSIIGPTVCTGVPATCSSSGNGIGISAISKFGIKVFNGNIQGMGGFGILASILDSLVERVNASSNGKEGINAGRVRLSSA